MTTGDAPQSAAGTSPPFPANASALQNYGISYALALNPAGSPPAPPPDDFSIVANPTSLTSSQGSSVTSALTITPSGAFSGTVSLSVSGNPAGSTAAVNPTSVTVGPAVGNSTLTISPGTAAAGTYTVTVTGVSGALTHTAPVSYTIAPPPPPAGTIAFHGASTNSYPSASTTVVTAAIPAGAVPGDLLVASVGFGNTSATTLPAISTPAGWTLVRRVDHGTVNSLSVYWHVYAKGDGAPVWTTSQSVGGAVSISAYAGVSATPIDASAVNDAGAASTYSAPTLVTTGPNELVVIGFYAHSASGAPTTWTVPAPPAQRSNFNNAGSRSMTTADALQAAAGTSRPFAANASVLQNYALAYAIALVPAG